MTVAKVQGTVHRPTWQLPPSWIIAHPRAHPIFPFSKDSFGPRGLDTSTSSTSSDKQCYRGRKAARFHRQIPGPTRAVEPEMRKTVRLGTNKARRTPTRALLPHGRYARVRFLSRSADPWMVREAINGAYARLLTRVHPLESATCTRRALTR